LSRCRLDFFTHFAEVSIKPPGERNAEASTFLAEGGPVISFDPAKRQWTLEQRGLVMVRKCKRTTPFS
jgi:hypothetical protein